MQPPIKIGTVLQDRYLLTKILSRVDGCHTYLAEDHGRFKELCVLKELIPAHTEEHVLASKELFQREATILYQLQHPQIPQFQATFLQSQSLFLVQEYVEGRTYAQMLEERRLAGQTFSEAEVLQLFGQLLPVLEYLHDRGVIHRQISPNNIILRHRDRLPVLTDFGIIKELATRLQSPQSTLQVTTPKGLGYAPIEQIQTGKAYPSSDLYSLAVTAVVLLTGREPQELFDDKRLMWNWQRWTTLSPEFSKVLDRMLSYRPIDRYPSAAEALGELPDVTNLTPSPPTAPDLPWMQSVVVGNRPSVTSTVASKPEQAEPAIAVSKNRQIWDNPLAIAIVGLTISIAAGVTSWLFVSYLLDPTRHQLGAQRPVPPQAFPSPLVSKSSTPAIPTTPEVPTPSSKPLENSQYLGLKVGQKTTVRGRVKVNTATDYTFSGEQGQQLSAALAESDVLLTVLGPDSTPINSRANQVKRYRGTLSATGDYTVRLSLAPGVTQSRYRLNLLLTNPVQPAPSPDLTPTSPTMPTSTPSIDLTPSPTPSADITPTISPTANETE